MQHKIFFKFFTPLVFIIFIIAIFFLYQKHKTGREGGQVIDTRGSKENDLPIMSSETKEEKTTPTLDRALYDKKLEELANNPPNTVATSTASSSSLKQLWPVKTVYPLYGALLPFNRVIAYYGNFYSKKMGVLGEYPEDVMLSKLADEVISWQKADPSTPVIPAIHYIASTAQSSPGADSKHTMRMPSTEIDKALLLGKKAKGIVFLDLQIGHSDLLTEVAAIEPYLKLPDVHLGIDPEFAMKDGVRPGVKIGTLDGEEVNQVTEYIAKIVREHNLPPKILVIHRFTEKMLTNYDKIKLLPEVQIVIDMDGWGDTHLKKRTYENVIYNEPVQFTGFKLFYKNDTKMPGSRMLTPEELLKLRPIPSYIQYQ